MGKIPSKPVVTNQPWINGVTKLNQVNLTNGINQNITNVKTAVDGIIDALGGPGGESASDKTLDQSSISAYNPATTYSQGQVVIYNDKYYRAKENNVTGAWNEEKWSQIALSTPVDSALSSDSTNPVQNKVVKEELDTKAVLGAFNGGGTGVDYSDLANNLIATKGLEVESYFTFEKTGGAQSSAVETGNGTLKNLYGKTEKSENLLIFADEAQHTIQGITIEFKDGVCSLSGTATATFNFGIEIKNLPAGTYSSKIFISGSTDCQNYWVISNATIQYGNIFRLGLVDGETNTATTTDTGKYIRFLIVNGTTYNNYKVRFMLVQGSTAPTAWSQGYDGLKHTNITGLKSTSINLFDGEWELGQYNQTTGAKEENPTAKRSKNFIPCSSGKYYHFNIRSRFFFYDENKNYLGNLVSETNSIFEVPTLAKFMTFQCHTSQDMETVCINFSDATINGKYYPFEQDTLNVAFEGNGVGTAHDELDVENGKKITRTLEITFNGSQDWFFGRVEDSSFESGYFYYAQYSGLPNTILKPITQTNPSDIIWSGKVVSINSGRVANTMYISTAGTLQLNAPNNNTITTKADFLTWLSNNPLTIVIPLATPTTTDVTIPKDTIKVWNGGSMEALGTEVPVGTKIFYQKNLKNFIEGLGKATNWDPESINDAILDVAGDIAPEYSASQTYSKGDLVIHERVLYKANQDIATAEAWNAAHWTRTTVAEAAPENFEAITWSDLKTLRDTSKLVPGKQYRITDYLTAVEQPECRSAGHPFDIVVTALAANALSEDVKAVAREGDNYFVMSATWKPGITVSDIETFYKMADGDSPYTTPVEKERIFTQMGTMVNPTTGIEVPYLFEPSPESGGEPSEFDRRYLFVGEYEFNGVVYDQWEECYVNGTLVRSDEGVAYYELTNVVVDVSERVTLAAWKLKYCLDNDYDRFGFAVRHEVIRVSDDENDASYLYLRYPSLDGDDGLAWAYISNGDDLEIEDPRVSYDNLDTSDIIYTPSLSINVGDELDMGGDPVTVVATRIGKGVIYKMEDEWDNSLPYDFKNVQFKRYLVTQDTSAYDGFDGQYVGCKNIRGSIASPEHYTVEDDSDFKWCYTFNWYNEVGDSEDYSIIGNTRLHNDEDVISGCYNNVFGNCLESDLSPAVETYQNRMYLGNNVLWDAYEKNDGISPGFRSNTIGNSFYYSTMGNSFSINIMGNNFNNNTGGDEFSFNVGGNGFRYSTVGNNFNTNTVGNNFNTNTVGDGFSGNTIGNSFNSNTVGSNFYSNTVGNKFQSNIVGNYIYSSSIKDGISYITLDAPSGSVGNKLQYITIGSSVYGSYYNRLAITPVRNANYEQEYVNDNKVVNPVSVL